MPRMHYTARTLAGKIVEGRARADNEQALRNRLSARGLEVLEVRGPAKAASITSAKARSSQAHVRFYNRVRSRAVASVTGQLALMLRTGTPLLQSMEALAYQIDDERLSDILGAVAAEVRGGSSLAEALASHPAAFDTFYVSTVKAGEASGTLPEAFKRLEEHMQKRAEIRSNVVTALIYPIIVSVLAAACVTVVVTFVVPRFVEVFEGAGVVLPLPTRMLVAFSDFIITRWYVVAGIAFSLPVAVYFTLTSERGSRFRDMVVLEIPLVGALANTVMSSGLLRTLGTLMGSGVSLVESLQIARETCRNGRFSAFVDSVMNGIVRGEDLTSNFARSDLMSPAIKQMVATAEQTGALAEVLTAVADHLDDVAAKQLKKLSAVFEPLIIVAMGVVVGFIAVSVLLPMFRLTSAAHGGG